MAENGGATSFQLRNRLAAKAYARTAAYDAAISGWFAGELDERAPRWRTITGKLSQQLRYGENPHQWAAFYTSEMKRRPGVATAVQHQGKELSYNNLNDTDAAFELVAEFDPATAAVAIIKHANPCGVAQGSSCWRPTVRLCAATQLVLSAASLRSTGPSIVRRRRQ